MQQCGSQECDSTRHTAHDAAVSHMIGELEVSQGFPSFGVSENTSPGTKLPIEDRNVTHI